MLKYHRGSNIFVNQIVLKVMDIERATMFYKEIMGFEILDKKEKQVLFTADGIHPIITIVEPQNVQPKLPRRTGLYHFAILLPSRFHLGQFLKHIREAGYPLIGGSNHGVSEALYLEDPDGNGIEIYRDTDPMGWKRNGNEINMVTEPLDYKGIILEAGEGKWEGMSQETIIGHIHLHVADLDESKRFYCQGLGFDLVTQIPNSALFISSGGYHHHIGLNIWNGKNALPLLDDSVGMKYYSLVFPDKDTRENAIKNLEDLGYEILKEENVIFTKDPSKNLIKLV